MAQNETMLLEILSQKCQKLKFLEMRDRFKTYVLHVESIVCFVSSYSIFFHGFFISIFFTWSDPEFRLSFQLIYILGEKFPIRGYSAYDINEIRLFLKSLVFFAIKVK